MKYLALLRGINVGGNNIIKKDTLQEIFKSIGSDSVITYIQSGNILFTIRETPKESLIQSIQEGLKKKLGKQIPVVIYTESEYKTIVETAPKYWGNDETKKHNALFPIAQTNSEKEIPTFPEVNAQTEKVTLVKEVLFWSGSKEQYSKTSYATKLAKSSLYKHVTVRNANTVKKILELFKDL